MATITKKELIDRIAERTQAKRVTVKCIIQAFLDEVTRELCENNRLEFRDFGVFESAFSKPGSEQQELRRIRKLLSVLRFLRNERLSLRWAG